MPSLTLRSIPEDLMKQLRASAAEHRRSLNSEVLVRLERSMGGDRPHPDAVLARIEALPRRAELPPLTDEFLEKASAEGRS
ncbi:hypothetical protein BH20GEM2_BH20GEM2_21620 [soil metagenome]